jgi:hypothetical protein
MSLIDECAVALAAYEGDSWDDLVAFRQDDYREAVKVVLATAKEHDESE